MQAMKIPVTVLGLALLLMTSCDVKSLFKDKVVTDPENRFQLSVPFLWQEMSDLHDDADIEVAYPRKDLYCIVLVENKEDFTEMDLELYAAITRESILENLENAEESELRDFELHTLQAKQCLINGSMDNLNLVYIHTAVETEENYLQIISWTSKSSFKKYREDLEKVVSSFQLVDANTVNQVKSDS